MTNDDIVTPEAGGELEVELRGYELARAIPGDGKTRWSRIGQQYSADQTGFTRALKEAKWWCEKYPNETFRVRPVVSFQPPPADVAEEANNG